MGSRVGTGDGVSGSTECGNHIERRKWLGDDEEGEVIRTLEY